MPGFLGKIWGVIPLVVCTVFVISLVESLFILPAEIDIGPGLIAGLPRKMARKRVNVLLANLGQEPIPG